jgi:hypothetical protein
MDGQQVPSRPGEIARGVCPACMHPVARSLINVTQDFKCPHCQRLVRTSNAFRVPVYIACYGVPTVVVFFSGRALVASVLLWMLLVVVCSFLYIQIATRICTPRLIFSVKKNDEFQSLNLTK